LTRKRIYEIAKELGVTSKELIARVAELGMPDLKASNTVDEEEATVITHLYQDETAPTAAVGAPEAKEAVGAQGAPEEAAPAPEKHGPSRAPIVSVLGHIDHGKTTLLDAIRKSRLTDREMGGITQAIGAYQVDLAGRKITFIDTPGHKAFTGMRARGAKATDIAVLVVAADDGIMAQTMEAIDHIKAAGIPMIVAVNKIDKANADPDKVMNDLAQQGFMPEAWGGETITVPISALKGEHIDDLLEMILLVADMEDLRGDPDGELEAIVIESHLATGRGPVATAVVRQGMLREKDCIVAGTTHGRVKALTDENGRRVPEAGPGKAVEILGLQEVPPVGSPVEHRVSQNDARDCADERKAEQAQPRPSRARMSVEDLFAEAVEEEKLKLILKTGTTGGLEAARREIEALAEQSVNVEFLSVGVGPVSESDVILATTVSGQCVVVGFGNKVDAKAARLAEREGVTILSYGIIYELLDEIERTLKRMMAPEYREIELGRVDVRDLFKIPGGVVAGCSVVEGKIVRSAKLRVVREGETIFTGDIASLRRFENDVREVEVGRECGVRIKDFDDVQVGDRLVVFQLEEIQR